MKTLSTNPVYTIIAIRTIQVSLLSLAAHWLWHWPLTGPHALGLVVTPLLCLYFVFVFVAPWSWGLPLLTRLKTQEPVVALTFDDGPTPETTPRILDILKAHGVKATFFVLGEQVDGCPELLARIVREGHEVGLHGFHHRALALASWTSIRQELEWASAAVHAVCPEVSIVWFRPPYGFKTPSLPWLTRRCGLSVALWSLNPRDYREQSPKQLAQMFLKGLHPGAIALLHDNMEGDAVVEALPAVLDSLRTQGYRCVLLSHQSRFRE